MGNHTMLEGRHQGVKAAMAEMCFRAQAGILDSLAVGNRNQIEINSKRDLSKLLGKISGFAYGVEGKKSYLGTK